MENRIFNFSAGPAVLPESVLKTVRDELLNYQGSGMSVMEMSHRSKEYEAIIRSAEADLRTLMGIPDSYAVLFLQGGASLQFSMAPMNLCVEGHSVDVIETGSWTQKAMQELKLFSPYRVVASSKGQKFSEIPTVPIGDLDPKASYVYLTSNNTIYGSQWTSFPDTGSVPLVADMSSDILCRPVDVSKFGLIFAGAQKNIGPSGVTVVIMRKDLAERASQTLPTMLQYRTHIANQSMYNTPPTFAIYVSGLVFKWLLQLGGLEAMHALNRKKAQLLYQAIDASVFYYCPIQPDSRSLMNVVFRIKGDREELESKFAKESEQAGLSGLKGHRSAGGLRASIYNAQPIEAVEALVRFMADFAAKNG